MARRRARSVTTAWVAALAATALMVGGCSSGSGTAGTASPSAATSPPRSTTTLDEGSPDGTGPDDAEGTTDESTDDSSEPTTTLPAGATAGLDDLNEDGTPDPTCGTADYGAGLTLRIPCEDMGLANEPSDGVTLVAGSLFAFPSGDYALVSEVSGSVIQARDAAGSKVVVFFISADTLFDVGSAQLGDPAVESLTPMAARIGSTYPGATVQVRGHTDSTGDATTNQTLSEQRARNVADLLGRSGVDPAHVTAVGLGSTVPIAVETNSDGTANEPGRHEDRRVEIVVRPAS